MPESGHCLNFINSSGAQESVPLFTVKAEALATDRAGGQAFAVRAGNETLYAPTNDQANSPNASKFHFVDSSGKIRHVHKLVWTKLWSCCYQLANQNCVAAIIANINRQAAYGGLCAVLLPPRGGVVQMMTSMPFHETQYVTGVSNIVWWGGGLLSGCIIARKINWGGAVECECVIWGSYNGGGYNSGWISGPFGASRNVYYCSSTPNRIASYGSVYFDNSVVYGNLRGGKDLDICAQRAVQPALTACCSCGAYRYSYACTSHGYDLDTTSYALAEPDGITVCLNGLSFAAASSGRATIIENIKPTVPVDCCPNCCARINFQLWGTTPFGTNYGNGNNYGFSNLKCNPKGTSNVNYSSNWGSIANAVVLQGVSTRAAEIVYAGNLAACRPAAYDRYSICVGGTYTGWLNGEPSNATRVNDTDCWIMEVWGWN